MAAYGEISLVIILLQISAIQSRIHIMEMNKS